MWVRDSVSGNAPARHRASCGRTTHPVATSDGSPRVVRSATGVQGADGSVLTSLARTRVRGAVVHELVIVLLPQVLPRRPRPARGAGSRGSARTARTTGCPARAPPGPAGRVTRRPGP